MASGNPNELRTSSWEATYGELRVLASHLLRRERGNHTLQPTALVHEMFLRCQRDRRFKHLVPSEVLASAGRIMRDILIEHARHKGAQKRGGYALRLPLDEVLAVYEERAIDILVLDEALTRLEKLDPDLARLVELRFFAGLSEAETAEALGVSTRTARRSWRVARLWIASELGGEAESDE